MIQNEWRISATATLINSRLTKTTPHLLLFAAPTVYFPHVCLPISHTSAYISALSSRLIQVMLMFVNLAIMYKSSYLLGHSPTCTKSLYCILRINYSGVTVGWQTKRTFFFVPGSLPLTRKKAQEEAVGKFQAFFTHQTTKHQQKQKHGGGG